MFINSNTYDYKFQKLANKMIPNQENIGNLNNNTNYTPILPIKYQNYADFVLNHRNKPGIGRNYSPSFLPSKSPIIERVFRPSVLNNLHSQQMNLNNLNKKPDSMILLPSKRFNQIANNEHNNDKLPLINIPNSEKLKQQSLDNSIESKNSSKPSHHHHHHRKVKSKSYHIDDNPRNVLHEPRNSNFGQLFPGFAQPNIGGFNPLNSYNTVLPMNNYTQDYLNNSMNMHNPYDNNSMINMNMALSSNSLEEKILSDFLEKKKERKNRKLHAQNEENNKFMQNMIKKQSELLKKLVETRENNRRKKEKIEAEELRNKINIMESKLMFKKFEGDQMNFLLDLKTDIKNKLENLNGNFGNYNNNYYNDSMNYEIYKQMQKNMIFNAMTYAPRPSNFDPTSNGFANLNPNPKLMPHLDILDI